MVTICNILLIPFFQVQFKEQLFYFCHRALNQYRSNKPVFNLTQNTSITALFNFDTNDFQVRPNSGKSLVSAVNIKYTKVRKKSNFSLHLNHHFKDYFPVLFEL